MSITFPVLLTAAGCGTWFSSHLNTDNRSVRLGHLSGTRPPRWTSSRDGPKGRFPLGKTSVHLATTAPHRTTPQCYPVLVSGFMSTWKVTMGSRFCFVKRRRLVIISLRTLRRVLCLRAEELCVYSAKRSNHTFTNQLFRRPLCVMIVVWGLSNELHWQNRLFPRPRCIVPLWPPREVPSRRDGSALDCRAYSRAASRGRTAESDKVRLFSR